MRIAFFAWEYPPRLVGGLGTYAEYITREYVRLGNDVTVLTMNNGSLKTSEVMQGVAVHRPLGVDVSGLLKVIADGELRSWGDQLRFFSSILVNDILCCAKLSNQLVRAEGSRFDIACVHDWMGAMAAPTLKSELSLPLVFHVHSTEWGRSGGRGSKAVNDIEFLGATTADRIITVSYAMKEDLAGHGWPADRIHVVWNGIDPDTYDPAKAAMDEVAALRKRYGIDTGKMILFVGRLNWVKGIMNLVQAMPAVLIEHPEAKLVILGTGDEENDVRHLAARLGLEKSVICRFEFVSEHERILHYAASDLCVFPSIYEPFGIVSLEAMAMEKPIVVGASGVSGLKEQVVSGGDGRTGVHVDGNSPADIAWGINEALQDEVRMKRWGKAARKRVLEYFTWDKVARETLSIYEELLHERR
ncbi:MAG TPA: glycosyltransferase family 4 protein [Methanocella sp.]|uniref:glycosyltransferase family 4 protein n=1 Tax=Methanocella sp. TaxID=2052833 RepID=UPI002C1D833A|nr:glycosyltransferase family 4 protein [Methanocella sp.]HTY91716.1 glycosyltransferase family 4 protein [Methanocella sp.]